MFYLWNVRSAYFETLALLPVNVFTGVIIALSTRVPSFGSLLPPLFPGLLAKYTLSPHCWWPVPNKPLVNHLACSQTKEGTSGLSSQNEQQRSSQVSSQGLQCGPGGPYEENQGMSNFKKIMLSTKSLLIRLQSPFQNLTRSIYYTGKPFYPNNTFDYYSAIPQALCHLLWDICTQCEGVLLWLV